MVAATYFDLVTYLQWLLLVALGSIFYGLQEAGKEIKEVKEILSQFLHAQVGSGDGQSANTKR